MLVAGCPAKLARRMRSRDLPHTQTCGAIVIGLEPNMTAYAYCTSYAACGGASPCVCKGAAKLKMRSITLFSETACLPIFPNQPANPKGDPLHGQEEKHNANRGSELRPFRNCMKHDYAVL
jgi:hypothetical protein